MIVTPATAMETVVGFTEKVMVTQEHKSSKRHLYDVIDESEAAANPGTLYLRYDDQVWAPRELADSEPDADDFERLHDDLLAEEEQGDLYAELGMH